MKKKHHVHHLWLILGAYGVWFALLSGLEEVSQGTFWKMGLSLLFGALTYIYIEYTMHE